MQIIEPELEQEHYEIMFHVRRSIRYHNYRRDFYDTLQLLTTFISLLMSSAAVATVLSNHKTSSMVISLVIASINAINLVLRSSEKGRLHTDLAKRFIEIEKNLISCEIVTNEILRKCNADILVIEADEPPVKVLLNARCHNEILRADKADDSYYVRLSFLQNSLAQIMDIGASKLKPEIANQQYKSLEK